VWSRGLGGLAWDVAKQVEFQINQRINTTLQYCIKCEVWKKKSGLKQTVGVRKMEMSGDLLFNHICWGGKVFNQVWDRRI